MMVQEAISLMKTQTVSKNAPQSDGCTRKARRAVPQAQGGYRFSGVRAQQTWPMVKRWFLIARGAVFGIVATIYRLR
jgi:hypothetical protein